MNKISKWFIIPSIIVMGLAMVACTDFNNDDDMPGEFAYTVPELDIEALDSCDYVAGSFTIDAPGNWRVESDKMWLTLSLDSAGVYVSEERGGKGTHTVYVKVTNAAREFVDATAVIKLITDTEVFVVTTVLRPAKEYKLTLMSAEGDVIDDIRIGYSGVESVRVEANYECAVVEYPNWLEEPVVNKGLYTFSVVQDSIPVERRGKIVVSDITMNVKREFEIVYDGMNPNNISVSGEHDPWWWNVSADGKVFKKLPQEGLSSTEEVVVENSLSMNVVCRNFDYSLLFIEENDELYSLKTGDDAWIKGACNEAEKGAITITVEPNALEKPRTGYLFAVPEAMCDSFMTVTQETSSVEMMVETFVNNVIAHITQEGIVVEGGDGSGGEGSVIDEEACVVTDNDGNVSYSVVEPDLDVHTFLFTEFFSASGEIEEAVANDKNVVTCDIVPGKAYSINTKVTGNNRNFELLDYESAPTWKEISGIENWNAGMVKKDDGNWYLEFTVPESFDKTVVVRISSKNNINIKIIIMRIKK